MVSTRVCGHAVHDVLFCDVPRAIMTMASLGCPRRIATVALGNSLRRNCTSCFPMDRHAGKYLQSLR